MTSFAQMSTVIEARPEPTPEQYAAARRHVAQHAPDLLDAIFGTDTKEN